MKSNFYKTNGMIEVETSNAGGICFLTRGVESMSLNNLEMEFLMKCFNELLEE